MRLLSLLLIVANLVVGMMYLGLWLQLAWEYGGFPLLPNLGRIAVICLFLAVPVLAIALRERIPAIALIALLIVPIASMYLFTDMQVSFRFKVQ